MRRASGAIQPKETFLRSASVVPEGGSRLVVGFGHGSPHARNYCFVDDVRLANCLRLSEVEVLLICLVVSNRVVLLCDFRVD